MAKHILSFQLFQEIFTEVPKMDTKLAQKDRQIPEMVKIRIIQRCPNIYGIIN